MATEKKKNIFQQLLQKVRRGLESASTRIAVGAPQVRKLATATGREIDKQIKPLYISLGERNAYKTPSIRRDIETARKQNIETQKKLIIKASITKDPEQKKKLLKLAQETGKVAAEGISKTSPTYTPREIVTSGIKTAGLIAGGPKMLTKAGAITTGISGGISGIIEKVSGGKFIEGAARGIAYTPHILAVTRATDPIIYRIIPSKGNLAPRISAAVANVIQGKGIDISSGRPTTPQSVVLDLVTGALGGKSSFRPIGGVKAKFTMDRKTFDELVEAEEILRSPDKYVDTIKSFPGPVARDKAVKTAVGVANETIERLAAKYLPDKVLTKVAGDTKRTIKALADLSGQNKLANIPSMAFSGGTKTTRSKIRILEQKVSQAIEEGSAKAQEARVAREPFTSERIKDFNLLKRLSRVPKYAEGDLMTYRNNYPQLTERAIESVREARPDIKTEEDAMSFILNLPTKADTEIARPLEVKEITKLTKEAKIEERGIREGRRLERGALKAERQEKLRTRAEEEAFNRELGESGGEGIVPTQKEYIENFRKEVAPLNLKEKERVEKDTRRLSNLLNYNDTLRRMGYSAEQVKKIGFLEAEKLIRENVSPKSFFDRLEPNVARDLRETDKALGDVSKVPTPLAKRVNSLDLFRTPDRVLNKMGLGREARFLRHQYERYLTELPIEINRITEWSKRIDDSRKEELFKFLDGKPANISLSELRVAREIQSYLKGWAEKLHLPKDNQMTNYITHIFERDFITKEFDEDLAKLITDKQPGSVYDPFLQKRLGMYGYIQDPWRALDAYVKRAVRKVNMDPALDQLKVASQDFELSQAKYIRNYAERINMRPTEMDNQIDNFVKLTPIRYKLGQRPVAAFSQATRQAVFRGTLGLNVATAIKNLTQGANTYAKLGEKYTLLGYMKALKDMVYRSGELEETGVLRGSFIEDRQISSVKKFWEKADKALFFFFENAERLNRGAAYYGAKSRALAAGATEEVARQVGKDLARDTQFTFGSVDTPAILQSDIAKSLLQFQSYSIKQAEFLGEMIQNKEYAGLARWLGANLVLMAVIGDAIGMDLKKLLPSVKVGGSPTFNLAGGVIQLFSGNENKRDEAIDNIKKSIVAHIPAGIQAKKAVEGFGANLTGGVFNDRGQLKYPVGKETEDQIFNVIFGPGKGEGSSFYFDHELSPLSDTDTRLWQGAVEKGEDPYSAWAIIYKKRIAEGIDSKIRSLVRDPKMSVEEKTQEAQKIIDDAQSLIQELNKYQTIEEVLPTVEEVKQETLKPPTSKKIAFGVKVKKGAKPTLKKRVLKIKKSNQETRLARLTPIRVYAPEVKQRRYAIA